MKVLPIGVQDFFQIRQDDLLYVDKTAKLLQLIQNGRRYFLSRPRRFGKSLTLSTLEAMFKGEVELFKELKAEEWVKKQAEKSFSVLKLDMSGLRRYRNAEELNISIIRYLEEIAFDNKLNIIHEDNCDGILRQIIRALYNEHDFVVILIDEYDKPILDNITDLEKANEMREVLRSFYTMLKSCNEYLSFVFITGISKFSKTGVFSAMNNLADISFDQEYGAIAGYTQDELEFYFHDWIDNAAAKMKISSDNLLVRLKDYYDGFSFDGSTRLYNPFSIMLCLSKGRLGNYWYTSGSPSFIAKYMKEHKIQNPDDYRHMEVPSDFADSHEIETSKPESFLYQSGYLTIEKWENDIITLDYPNEEVRKSLARMYLDEFYHLDGFITLGTQIWQSLTEGDIEQVIEIYNIAIANIPYEDFPKSLFSIFLT